MKHGSMQNSCKTPKSSTKLVNDHFTNTELISVIMVETEFDIH